MQTRTVISQIVSLPHGVGVSISLNIENGDTVLSSEPLTMFTIGSERTLADQLGGLNGLIAGRGWPVLTPDQVLRIGALREVATATDSSIAALAGGAAAVAVAENAVLAADKVQLQADRDLLKAQLDAQRDAA